MLMVFENALFFINDAARLLDLLKQENLCFPFNSFQDAYTVTTQLHLFLNQFVHVPLQVVSEVT